MPQTNMGVNVFILEPEKSVTMNISLNINLLFRGETKWIKFLKVNRTPLPKSVIPLKISKSWLFLHYRARKCWKFEGREILQLDDLKGQEPEFRVYTRRKNHQNSREPTVPKAQNQSNIRNDEPVDMQGTLNPLLFNIVLVLDTCNDLNIPIALRKSTQSCTKRPIAKYLSYKKLSRSHRHLHQKPLCLFWEILRKYLMIQNGNQ